MDSIKTRQEPHILCEVTCERKNLQALGPGPKVQQSTWKRKTNRPPSCQGKDYSVVFFYIANFYYDQVIKSLAVFPFLFKKLL
jgi:hypothetical protein